MSCLCLGPKRSGKSHLLKALQDPTQIDATSYSMSNNGVSVYNINLPYDDDKDEKASAANEEKNPDGKRVNPLKSIKVMEIGGAMSPIWHKYYDNVSKIIYVVDTSNLCQISAAGVLFYSILAEPRLQKVRILLVLAKMDLAYRQMRNEALLMLQMSKLQEEVSQSITIVEASAVTRVGLQDIYKWLRMP